MTPQVLFTALGATLIKHKTVSQACVQFAGAPLATVALAKPSETDRYTIAA